MVFLSSFIPCTCIYKMVYLSPDRLVLDLIFAFDGSKSITKENWIQQVELVQNLLHRLRFSNKGTHVGIIDFSDHIHDRVRLVDGYKDSYIFTKLKDMKAHFEGGSHTYTDKALADAAKLFKESPLSRDAPPVLVVLTDGKMTLQDHFKGVRLVKERTAELKALGVKIFCITFGKAIYIEGLHSIVGLHADKDIFHAQSFNATEFVQRLQELFRREKAISGKSQLISVSHYWFLLILVPLTILCCSFSISCRSFLRRQILKAAGILYAIIDSKEN